MPGKNKIRLALDAMGGDNAPEAIVAGAVEAHKLIGDDLELILVGDSRKIKAELEKLDAIKLPIKVEHADDVISMDDEPAESVRTKKKSSIVVGLRLQKDGKADGFISAGNTGAVMAGSLLNLGRLKKVHRPAIGTIFPTKKSPVIVLDVGANSDCKAINLYQFAVMGSIYYSQMFSDDNPKVGLLSIGEEQSKGNELTVASHKLIKAGDLNFIGNIEGRDILNGDAKVVVCDGFVGNIILKFAESIGSFFSDIIRQEIHSNVFAKIGALLLRPAFRNFKKKLDYAEYGGAPLLGVNGVSIICHGSSSPKAIKNAVKIAKLMVEKQVNQRIESKISGNENPITQEEK